MLTTQSLAGVDSETLQSFVLRRLTEDEPSIRNKIYDLVMEFHSVQSTSKSSLLETGDRRVSFVENDNVDLIQESAVSKRIRASGLVAKSGFHCLVFAIHAIMLEEGWPPAIEVRRSGTSFRPDFIGGALNNYLAQFLFL